MFWDPNRSQKWGLAPDKIPNITHTSPRKQRKWWEQTHPGPNHHCGQTPETPPITVTVSLLKEEFQFVTTLVSFFFVLFIRRFYQSCNDELIVSIIFQAKNDKNVLVPASHMWLFAVFLCHIKTVNWISEGFGLLARQNKQIEDINVASK